MLEDPVVEFLGQDFRVGFQREACDRFVLAGKGFGGSGAGRHPGDDGRMAGVCHSGFVGFDERGDVAVVGSEVTENLGSLGDDFANVSGIGEKEVDVVAFSMMPARGQGGAAANGHIAEFHMWPDDGPEVREGSGWLRGKG